MLNQRLRTKKTMSSWWLNNPVNKMCESNLLHLPPGLGGNMIETISTKPPPSKGVSVTSTGWLMVNVDGLVLVA